MSAIDEKGLAAAAQTVDPAGIFGLTWQECLERAEAAITAYLAALAPQQAAPMPVVKALEWSEGESRVTADCLTGRYILDGHKGRWTVSVPTASVSKGKGPAECERKAYPSLFAAKAAAQADYKQRILATLATPEAGTSEPVAWRYRFSNETVWQISSEDPTARLSSGPIGRLASIEPLYTHPAPAQAPVDGEAVLVPRHPTPEMLGAWYRYKSGHHFLDETAPADTSDVGAYAAMLAAAPSARKEPAE